jgi:ABC-2 type transport system permease protein
MRAYWQLVWAQLLLFFRNRNTIIWSFFLPIFMMVALGTLIGNGGSQITFKMAVVDLDKSSESQRFAAELRRLKGRPDGVCHPARVSGQIARKIGEP